MTYFSNFDSKESISEAYQGTSAQDLLGATVHIAWYGYGSYCGSSIVIYEKNGKLYEVNGSHCSCNGLEEQWSPEETSWKAIGMRPFDFGGGEYDGWEKAKAKLLRLLKDKNVEVKE